MIRAFYILLASYLLSNGATYYVATTGNDSGAANGSTGNPFATLGYAVRVARTNQVKTILVKSGNYYNTEVWLTNSDSGLTISADVGATPVLYGGQPMTGWVANGPYQELTLPTFPSGFLTMTNWDVKDLLVDGVRLRRARFPDYGSGTFDTNSWLSYAPSNTSFTVMKYFDTDIPDALVVTNAELELVWVFASQVVRITNLDTVAKTVMVSPSTYQKFGSQTANDYAVLNTIEGMHPCYWFHDRENNKLVVQTNTLAGHEVLVPAVATIINIVGAAGNYVDNVTLSGLSLKLTTVPISSGPGVNGARDYPGSIRAAYSRFLTITDCSISHVAGMGIDAAFTPENENTTITGNTLTHCGACGMHVPASSTGIVSLNTVQGMGELYRGGSGIWEHSLAGGLTAGGPCITIVSNIVLDTGYNGITAGYSRVGGYIWGNIVSNAMSKLADGGAIYTQAATNLTVIGNYCFSGPTVQTFSVNSGIYFDAGSKDCLAISNLVIGYFRPFLLSVVTGVTFMNNYFVSTTNLTPSAVGGGGNHVSSNIMSYSGPLAFTDTSSPAVDWSYNLYYSNRGSLGLPAGGYFAVPLWDSRYRLRAISPAIGMGIHPIFGTIPGTSISRVRAGYITQPP